MSRTSRLVLLTVAAALVAGLAFHLRSSIKSSFAALIFDQGQIRRVVTGHDAAGDSVVLSDTKAPNSERFNGYSFLELWRTTVSPAPIRSIEPSEPTDAPLSLAQPGGSVFRVVDYQPDSAGGRRTEMHRTRTIDYDIVLAGEITLILDHTEIELKAGDVVIQRGTDHAWENRGKQVARVAFVILDGAFSDELKKKIPGMVISP